MTGSWLTRRFFGRPGKSQAFLSAEFQDLEPVDVSFNHVVQLLGLGLQREASSITLRLRWRALRRPAQPWRCFVHLIADGRKLSSLDHEILGGRPSIAAWQPGDEAYESLRHWISQPPANLCVHLGLYDARINVRAAVLRSTLPVDDESSAVVIAWNGQSRAARCVSFDVIPLIPAGVVFERGLELTAYSVARDGELAWVRLKWTIRQGSQSGLRFFGHAVHQQDPAAPASAQFDQDLALDCRGPAGLEEQNIVRRLEPDVPWLRAGVYRPASGRRLEILSASGPADPANRCIYLRMAAPPVLSS